MNSIISLAKVSKRYSESVENALSQISLDVASGEFLVLVGPSGCGKSSLIKIIAGLEHASSGEISVPPKVSMVFQAGALFPWLSVADNLGIVLAAQKLPHNQIIQKINQYLELVNLREFSDKYPRELSGGQRQRVGIARALAIEPEVLILDEPFSALDIKTTEDLHNDLLRIWELTHQTIVMVSHSIEEAVTLADRIVLMDSGKIIQTFDLSQLKRPRREQATQFISDVQTVRRKLLEVAKV
ncbi:MAG: ABC transporter ATP-binding protein [Candidatus Saccharimonadia bacterium]